MKQVFTLFIILSFIVSCSPIKKLYTVYGDAKQRHEAAPQEPNVLRIYFDRKGFIYPDYPVPSRDFRNAYSYFSSYYLKDPTRHRAISDAYKVAVTTPQATATDPIQAEVIRSTVDKIAARKESYDQLVFLVHGFNKHPELPVHLNKPFRGNSTTEFAGLRKHISEHFENTRFLFVEIYWDGNSARNARKIQAPFNIAKFWNNANMHANNVGLEFRRILNSLNEEKFFIISHSLGASVVTSALFNTRQFGDRAYRQPKNKPVQYILQRQSNPAYNTPVQAIRAGMFAPAIPGKNVFDEYDQRTVNGQDVPSKDKNFSFVIGFNKHDRVVRKLINIPTVYGSTTLGCRASEIRAAKAEVGNDSAIMDDVNFSFKKLNKKCKQRSHSIIEYLKNEHFHSYLDKIFAK